MLFDNVEKSLPRNPIFSKGRKLRNSQDSTRLEMSTWTMLRTCRPLGTPRHGTGQGRAWQGRSNAIDEVCGRPIDGFSADKFITIVPQSCDRGEHSVSFARVEGSPTSQTTRFANINTNGRAATRHSKSHIPSPMLISDPLPIDQGRKRCELAVEAEFTAL